MTEPTALDKAERAARQAIRWLCDARYADAAERGESVNQARELLRAALALLEPEKPKEGE